MKKEFQAGTAAQSSTEADNSTSASVEASPMLAAALHDVEPMSLVKFNLNYNVKVRIKDKGIEHYVTKYNEIMPFRLHTSFKEFKQKADSDGYHTMQMHSFMDDFGCMGLGLADLVDTNIYLFQKDVEPVASVQ